MELNSSQNQDIAHLESYDLTLEVCLIIEFVFNLRIWDPA